MELGRECTEWHFERAEQFQHNTNAGIVIGPCLEVFDFGHGEGAEARRFCCCPIASKFPLPQNAQQPPYELFVDHKRIVGARCTLQKIGGARYTKNLVLAAFFA